MTQMTVNMSVEFEQTIMDEQSRNRTTFNESKMVMKTETSSTSMWTRKRRSIAIATNGFGDRVDRSSDADSNSEVRNSSSTRIDEQENRADSVFETQRNIRQYVEDRIKTSECD